MAGCVGWSSAVFDILDGDSGHDCNWTVSLDNIF